MVLKRWIIESVDVLYDFLGGIIQHLRMGQQAAVVLKESCLVEAVYDTLVQHELHINILALNNGAVLLHL